MKILICLPKKAKYGGSENELFLFVFSLFLILNEHVLNVPGMTILSTLHMFSHLMLYQPLQCFHHNYLSDEETEVQKG